MEAPGTEQTKNLQRNKAMSELPKSTFITMHFGVPVRKYFCSSSLTFTHCADATIWTNHFILTTGASFCYSIPLYITIFCNKNNVRPFGEENKDTL